MNDVFLRLNAGVPVDMETNNGRCSTLLMIAAFFGNKDVCRMLLARGASLEKTNNGGETSLHIACSRMDNSDTVRVLLHHYSSRNLSCINKQRDLDGATALLLACCSVAPLEIINLLIYNGACVKTGTFTLGSTPLTRACMYPSIEVAQTLISRGAEVDRALADGRTPLMIAVVLGNMPMTQMLLDNGASIKGDSFKGGVLHMVFGRQHIVKNDESLYKLVELLLEHPKVRTEDIVQVINSNREIDGVTPLYMACYNENLKMVELLISRGADVNRAIANGRTPLPMSFGRTPLSLAQNVSRSSGRHALVELLLSKGAGVAGVDSPPSAVV